MLGGTPWGHVRWQSGHIEGMSLDIEAPMVSLLVVEGSFITKTEAQASWNGSSTLSQSKLRRDLYYRMRIKGLRVIVDL